MPLNIYMEETKELEIVETDSGNTTTNAAKVILFQRRMAHF